MTHDFEHAKKHLLAHPLDMTTCRTKQTNKQTNGKTVHIHTSRINKCYTTRKRQYFHRTAWWMKEPTTQPQVWMRICSSHIQASKHERGIQYCRSLYYPVVSQGMKEITVWRCCIINCCYLFATDAVVVTEVVTTIIFCLSQSRATGRTV